MRTAEDPRIWTTIRKHVHLGMLRRFEKMIEEADAQAEAKDGTEGREEEAGK